MSGYVLSVLLLTGTCVCKAQQMYSDAAWERVGPGGGGATFIPTFSYLDANEFLLRCDMTGTYHSMDGGDSYWQLNSPNGAQSFAFAAWNRNMIYLGSSALYRTLDRGRRWEQVYPNADQVLGKTYMGDHAEQRIAVRKNVPYWPPGQTINSIRLDPDDTKSIYFTADHSLFFSHDEGGTWTTKDLRSPLRYLFLHQASVYIFSADSIYVQNNNSGKIKASALPAAMTPVTGFAAGRIKGTEETILYALHGGNAIWVSHDLGKTWTRSNGFPPKAEATRIACSEFDAASAYVLVDRLEESAARVWYGVWKTGDGGGHWDWVWKAGGGTARYGIPDGQNPANLRDGWAGRAFGKEWVEMMDLGVSPYDGNIAIATDWYRVMKTIDGGKTWKAIYSHDYADGRAASTGLDVTTTYGVHFDPSDHDHIAMSCTDIGFHHSFDGGKTWMRSVTGVPAGWVNTCYWVTFDPAVNGKLWSVWSGIHDLPRGKMTRDPQWKTHCSGGVCVSTDGGRTWTPQVNGMDLNSSTTCIALDGRTPAGHRTLYVTAYNKGVFKSVDDGKTWVLKNNGIDGNTCAFRIVLAGNGDLYLVTCPNPVFGAATDSLRYWSGAVYKSTDGADSWSKLDLGDARFPSGVAVDPSNPQRVYVACWADIQLSDLFGGAATRAAGGDRYLPMSGGIFLSEDGGRSWASVFDKKNYVYDVTVDAHHPGRVYCNTFTGAAWRSDDYGRSWRKIEGYDFHWGHRVIVDEYDPDKVYLTTYGSGVWHGYPRTPI
ncbi:MAG TPA: hypothetical protein VGM31_03470 [Puia sp.]